MAAVLDGRPFCLPRLYVYDEGKEALYLHGAHGGVTGKVLSQDPHGVAVAMTVYEMGRLLPADEAREFGLEYRSVVLTGKAVEVEDSDEALHGLQLFMEKYAPHLKAGKDYAPIAPEELIRTSVFRVDIESWSGKEKAAPPDFPGAFRLDEVR
jgi:nitroimidazol reductase NimA-like FMN-containing flavoprotein (pyridoxamine 5'-phosphate oxidase superfamily)